MPCSTKTFAKLSRGLPWKAVPRWKTKRSSGCWCWQPHGTRYQKKDNSSGNNQLLISRNQRNRRASECAASNGCKSQLLLEAKEQIWKPFQNQSKFTYIINQCYLNRKKKKRKWTGKKKKKNSVFQILEICVLIPGYDHRGANKEVAAIVVAPISILARPSPSAEMTFEDVKGW